MQSVSASPDNSYYRGRIHPVLTSMADEICATLARLVAYVGTLALLAICGIHLWDSLPPMVLPDSVSEEWAPAIRSQPAFAVSQFDIPDKTEAYEVVRHPQGGRKDVLRWIAQNEKPAAELEIYRPGGELEQAGAAASDLATRMKLSGGGEFETAGIIGTKFGEVTLLRAIGAGRNTRPCLGFIKDIDQPNVRLSGWSCQGDTLPARRAAVGCMLNGLVLLTSGNEPKLAELFARAELKRGDCAPGATSTAAADWVTGTENPVLRGAF